MSQQLRAIKTEYSGVIFRSKTEAVIARSLDLFGVQWEYEPYWLAVDDSLPDFLFTCVADGHRIQHFVMECKPKRPTETYRDQLRIRFLEIHKKYPYIKYFLLLVGSPFTGDERYVEFLDKREDGITDWARWDEIGPFEYWDEAKSYRFDLVPHGLNGDIGGR